jgi:hypothetical protein
MAAAAAETTQKVLGPAAQALVFLALERHVSPPLSGVHHRRPWRPQYVTLHIHALILRPPCP